MPESKKKDVWEKWDVLLKPVGGLLAAIAITFLGFYTSERLEISKEKETRARLFIELMSRREEAESALRKDMFKSIMDAFLSPNSDSPDAKLLKLELLTYNFHESLNLKPLFEDLNRQISREVTRDTLRFQYLERLNRAAREISKKQTALLKGGGAAFNRTIEFNESGQAMRSVVYADTLTLDGITRQFVMRVVDWDLESKYLKVQLTVNTPEQFNSGMAIKGSSGEFWVGFFDFPMIDNMRLSDDQRCAVVLTAFNPARIEQDEIRPARAEITLVYFPGSYASLKEKPYLQEVLDKLRSEATQRSP